MPGLIRIAARCAASALLLLIAATPLQAQPPAGAAPAQASSAARDTTRFLPTWLRPWMEFGGGWMSGPTNIKRNYESGQVFGVGLEARPNPRWSVRAGLDYQMLLANSESNVYVVYNVPELGGAVVDTVRFQSQTTGWIAGLRAEGGRRLAGDFWLTAGGGGGYMHSGLSGADNDLYSGILVNTSGAVANGWGWSWTGALRYDFEPAPRVPLGVEVRTSSLHRNQDDVRTWSVRLSLKMPEGPSPGRGAPHRR
jgi:hypothetical protein